jgi:hypothetical protein
MMGSKPAQPTKTIMAWRFYRGGVPKLPPLRACQRSSPPTVYQPSVVPPPINAGYLSRISILSSRAGSLGAYRCPHIHHHALAAMRV